MGCKAQKNEETLSLWICLAENTLSGASVSPEPYCSVFSWFWGLTSSEKCRLWWQTAYLWEEILYLRIVAFKVQRQKQPCAQLSHTELLMQVYYSDWRCYTFLKTQRNGNWLGLESICSKNTLYQNRKPLNFLTSFFPLFFFFSTANSLDQELQVPAELQGLVLFLWTFWIIWPETKHSKHIKQHTLTKQTWPGACQTVVSWICGTETPRWATSLSLGV